jgi:phage shock protein A
MSFTLIKEEITMKTLKKLIISIKSQIDNAADQFENHEALANAAIQDLQAIGAKTSVHLRHIQELSSRLQQKQDDLQQQASRWSSRAVTIRAEDEQRTLQCVKRLRQTQEHIEQVDKQLHESKRIERQIKIDLESIRDKLQMLKKKKELLAARQNRTEAMSALDKQSFFCTDEIQEVFERWENNVVGAEFQYQDLTDEDAFAAEFEQAEDDLELKAMLDELSSNAKQKNVNNSTGEPL